MKFLRNLLDKPKHHFEKGGKLEKFYPIYELIDTFLYTPADVTRYAAHIRDGIDLKRMMITVAVALTPCMLMAMYNTGYQANLAFQSMQAQATTAVTHEGWRAATMLALGLSYDANSILSNFTYGALFFLPVFLVTNIVGGFWETIFAMSRKEDVNEGFLVTGMLIPLILPATIPLWQVALGTSFGVVIGKEVFGGTGMNVLNPALTTRAFLFFAYPAEMSGDSVWIAADGFSGATALADASAGGLAAITSHIQWSDAFLGFIPGSMGETSTLAALIGAAILLITGIGSWRIMLSVLLSSFVFVLLMNMVGASETNTFFSVPFYWHLVLGGYAFGLVFMATDPVSSAMTNKGKYYYGALIGFMVVLIRVINPAFPEGMMLSILFGNIFAPVIDHFVLAANIKRRRLRSVS